VVAQSGRVLAVDVGNSTTALAVVEPDSLTIRRSWRLASRSDRTADEWRSILSSLLRESDVQRESIVGYVIASVVPRITHSLMRMFQEWCQESPLIVSASSDLGIVVRVDRPEDVGADRLANAVAAAHVSSGPAVVVDAGTATKIDAISVAGDFLGGAIAPGIGIGLDILATRAARLYAVEIAAPAHVIGRNTTEAVQSGVVVGHIAMIEGLIARFQQVLGPNINVVATGGYGTILAASTSVIATVEPDLTLLGAVLIWRRQRIAGSLTIATAV
jgi:type III pantothenate kinase